MSLCLLGKGAAMYSLVPRLVPENPALAFASNCSWLSLFSEVALPLGPSGPALVQPYSRDVQSTLCVTSRSRKIH